MRRATAAALVAAALGGAAAVPVTAGGQGEEGGPAANPCLDAALRLRCPDLVMRRAYDLHLLRSPRGRLVLTAASAIVNVGEGPLEIHARRVSEYHMAARQVLRAKPGGRDVVLPARGRVDWYDTHTRGVYWKFRHAARFELYRLDADGRADGLVRIGPKVHYCFRDLDRLVHPRSGLPYAGSPRHRHFGACSQTQGVSRVTLGTSVGWADVYPSGYPQNSVSVTGLRGCFAYVLRVDPLDVLVETREDDNVSARTIRLPWRGTRLRGCPHVQPATIPR